MSDIQCVIVTPEKTEVDVRASTVTIPLFDGEMGILKGHSPLVGRLGYGCLRLGSSSERDAYFVDGGFVQVIDNVVSVLTDRVVSMKEITSQSADEAMRNALDLPSDTPESKLARDKACERARAPQAGYR